MLYISKEALASRLRPETPYRDFAPGLYWGPPDPLTSRH